MLTDEAFFWSKTALTMQFIAGSKKRAMSDLPRITNEFHAESSTWETKDLYEPIEPQLTQPYVVIGVVVTGRSKFDVLCPVRRSKSGLGSLIKTFNNMVDVPREIRVCKECWAMNNISVWSELDMPAQTFDKWPCMYIYEHWSMEMTCWKSLVNLLEAFELIYDEHWGTAISSKTCFPFGFCRYALTSIVPPPASTTTMPLPS